MAQLKKLAMKPEEEKLNRQLKVYVTSDEEIDLKYKAEILGMSFSSFARAILLEKQFHFNPKELRRIRYELNKIGVNINQLVRRANENNQLPDRKLLKSFEQKIVALVEEL